MRARSAGLTLGLGVPLAVVAGFALLGLTAPRVDATVAAELLGFAAVTGVLAIRVLQAGVVVRRDAVVVRSVFWSRRIGHDAFAGLALVPVLRRRYAALAAVTHEGEVILSPFAAWKMGTSTLWQHGAAAALAAPDPSAAADPAAAAAVLERCGRLERPAALTVARPDGSIVAVPGAIPWPGLTPATVSPVVADSAARYLKTEVVAVAAGFVLPALAAAVTLLSRDLAGVGELDQFNLPLPGNPAASLLLMLLLYASTAIVTPIALLLLARSGQPPAALHLGARDGVRDLGPAAGVLFGAWLGGLALALALQPLLDNTAAVTRSVNSHVPAYFVVYALFVSAVTAINEEVVVSAYLLTRLSQLGWNPWPALALSLTLRTSYHAYYGLALLLTVPFGFVATRSFQRSGRLWRAVLAHFTNDAILLSVAVLTS
jgi:membrane protease YdiL (CAAX protease family)